MISPDGQLEKVTVVVRSSVENVLVHSLLQTKRLVSSLVVENSQPGGGDTEPVQVVQVCVVLEITEVRVPQPEGTDPPSSSPPQSVVVTVVSVPSVEMVS